MLEIKILKVTHEGAAEAQKLVPFIQECDVFCPEKPACIEEIARKEEIFWQKIFEMNRFNFAMCAKEVHGHLPKLEQDYIITQDMTIFDSKKPILFLERFSKSESMQICEGKEKADKLYEQAKVLFRGGKDFLSIYQEALERYRNLYIKRDEEVARNINRAENLIREFYSHLKDINPIKMTLSMGALHNPEKYLATPYTVVDLSICGRGVRQLIFEKREQGIPYEKMRGLIMQSAEELQI